MIDGTKLQGRNGGRTCPVPHMIVLLNFPIPIRNFVSLPLDQIFADQMFRD